jgi:putative transposase
MKTNMQENMMTSVHAKHEALLDELLKDYTDPRDILGEHGLLKQLTKRVVERVLAAELTAHLGYAPHMRYRTEEPNARNGKGQKTVQTDTGPVDRQVPRDRHGSVTPQGVPKRQRRLEGFDAKGLNLYARGLATRAIQGHLEALYGTEVSPRLISTITEAVLDEVRTWHARPLASVYPILYCDALFVKSRAEGAVQTKAVDLALGVTMEGEKERLGLWLSESEGAKFWLSVFTERQNRGVTDCFIACVDGLKGLPEAIEAVLPKTQVQLCIVHKVRNSLKYGPWKERRAVAADLRAIYGATTLAAAEQALERFADRWDTKYPAISPSWLADWDRFTVFFDYPPAIRRASYTTNAIESLHYSLRKVLKGRGAFPNDESIVTLLYMGLQHVAKKWTQPIPEWQAALNQFVMLVGERVQV